VAVVVNFASEGGPDLIDGRVEAISQEAATEMGHIQSPKLDPQPADPVTHLQTLVRAKIEGRIAFDIDRRYVRVVALPSALTQLDRQNPA
jgi:hypothetical protein